MLTLKKFVVNLENVKPRVLRMSNTRPGVAVAETTIITDNSSYAPSTKG
jgi:hypothetical protein